MKLLIRKLVRESIQGYHLKKKSCSCGCNTCDNKPALLAPILNESLAPRAILSEGLKYHIDNNKPLTEHVYRAGSKNYFDLWAEARALYSRGIIDIKNQDDLEILTETQLGEFGYITEIEIGDKVKASKEYGGLSGEVTDIKGSFIIVKTKEGNKSYHESNLKVLNKEGKKVPLDFIMEEIEWPEEVMSRHGDIIFKLSKVLLDGGAKYDLIDKETGKIWEPGGRAYKNIEKLLDDADNTIMPQGGTRSTYLGETTKAKKKTPPIGKPKRGGSKKFYVYVRKPGGGIKKVSFGDTTGLSAKINNPEARRAFAKRHDCANKKDRTKASYWSCRLPRYAKLLGLKSNFSGFW